MKTRKTVKEIVFEILKKAKQPLHYKEITKLVLKECKLGGKTPHDTIRSYLGTEDRFKRVSEGVYSLSEWEEYPVARFAKDIAYDILCTDKKPMHMLELGTAVLSERYFVGGPKQVVKNVLRSDNRFYYEADNDLVWLVEWREGES